MAGAVRERPFQGREPWVVVYPRPTAALPPSAWAIRTAPSGRKDNTFRALDEPIVGSSVNERERPGPHRMGYRNLRECVNDLEATRQLVRIESEIDPYLEAAEVQRRVYHAGGPAVFYARVKGCKFPMVSNLFGTLERTRFLFRDALEAVRHLVELKIDPANLGKNP